jgi:L-cysteine desulfidase
MSAYAQVGGQPNTAAMLIVGAGRSGVTATLKVVA